MPSSSSYYPYHSQTVSLNSPSVRHINRIPSPTNAQHAHLQSPSTSPNLSAKSKSNNNDRQHRGAILVPTDRPLDELEDKWLNGLGRFIVEGEVLLHGYALYALRTWYLSRTHWAQTIVAQTGKPNEHISAYVLVPDPELSDRAAQAELSNAIKKLTEETHAQARQTEHGTLLVTTPSAFGQDIFPIPGGDLREMKPFLIVNTGLRRLGCGGRAAMGMESPIPAVRRKFFELYLLPTPPNAHLTRTTSPSTSPLKYETNSPNSAHSPSAISPSTITSDPFTHILVELIKLIQAALAIWGMVSENVEIDGLFCDETKAGIFAWRRSMGVEHEESMRLEKETSGGCIDPKTLAALLSSITSTRYQLDVLDVEKVPKDPLTSPRRFLQAWHAYQASTRQSSERADFLTVPSIRALNAHYLNERTRAPDALKMPRFLFSGVASATSSISANLKGGGGDETPLRKREHHHLRNRLEDGSSDSGFNLIVPVGELGPYAPPDVITSDLEAYTRGILKSREKDWDVMGVRRIAALWSGQTELHGRSPRRATGVLRRLQNSVDDLTEDGGSKGALGKISEKTGQAIKEGLGLVSRKGTIYETSDSDTGGPGPSSLRNVLARRKQHTVPTVVEADVEEVDELLKRNGTRRASSLNHGSDRKPAPHSPYGSHLTVDRSFEASGSRGSFLSATSHGRPRINTSLSHDSDGQSRYSLTRTGSPGDDRSVYTSRLVADERALVWRDRGRATAMLRTCSDGADVVVEDNGLEWEVINPHGTAKGRREEHEKPVQRSLQDRLTYRSIRLTSAAHLAIDVELCGTYLELRAKEKELSARAAEAKTIEESIFKASQNLIDAIKSRRAQISHLRQDADALEKELRKTVDEIEEDEAVQWASNKIQFYLSEDVNTNDIMWNLRNLEKEWEDVREKVEERKKALQKEETSAWQIWSWRAKRPST